MKVREVYEPSVHKVRIDEALVDAAQRMREQVGSLGVFQGETLAGIITERDLVRAMADGAEPKTVKVVAYMTRDPATIGPNADAEEAVTVLIKLHARHLPVVDGGCVVGMVSARDLLLTGPRIKARSKTKKEHSG